MLWPAALLGTTGCLGGGPVDLRYRPSRPARPLEAEGKLAIRIDRVEDQAGGIVLAEGERPRLLLRRPVQDSIREALTEEFRRLGLRIAGASAAADVLLNAALTHGEISSRESRFRSQTGIVRLTIALSIEDPNGRPLWQGELKGVGDMATSGDTSGAVNAALADAMEKIGPMLAEDGIVARIISAGRNP